MQNLRKIAFLGSVALTAFCVPAFAQQAREAGAANDRSDEIIVTARKREESLIDVPLPVTVATSAQLNRDQVRTITDLQRVTPALEISQTNGGEVNGGARLRGLGTGIGNATVSPSVAFVIDQVPQGNLTFPVLFDLGQVEVLRGPQGTLFGQGASAGVINISTVAPNMSGIHASGGIDFADKGTGGSEVGEMTLRGGFNLPFGEKVAIRLASQFKRERGLQRNTMLGRDNEIKELGLRLRALIKPSDTVTINLSGEYAKQNSEGWNFYTVATTPTNPGSLAAFLDPTGCNMPRISTRVEFYCEADQAKLVNTAGGVSGVIDFELSDALTLTSVSAYRKLRRETRTVDFSRRPDIAARDENNQDKSNQFSQELRLSYQGEGLDVVFGGLYSRFNLETTPIDRSVGFGSNLPGERTGFGVCNNAGTFCVVPTSLGYEDTTNRTLAAFTDATVSLTDRLDLFGGLRFSDYKNETGVGVNTFVATRSVDISDTNLSGRIGLSFKPNAGTTLFGSYSRGYKPPAVVVPTIATDPVVVLKPELADAFELGAKFEVGRLQISGNAFYSKVKNFQTQSFAINATGALVSAPQNIDKVVSKGFEVGVFGQVFSNLSVNAGYQFNVVKFPAGFFGNDKISLAGTQFLNAPKHKITFSGEFTQPVTESVEVFLNTNVVWKSSVLLGQYGDPRYRYPSHALVNGGIGIRNADGKWSAALFARNLTKQREPLGYLAGDFFGGDDGSVRAWPAAGITARVVGLSLSFSY
ncbi:TonB-dependent receptor [Novosphingobium sp. BL-52-GroH]|uniref:TonB-dependent receptor n=1 Tax=Novosphingobium sp. BL-52-GroH TaxID=3349877 RepID=UPI00384D0698